MLRPLLLPVLKFSCGLAALTALTACGKGANDVVNAETAVDGVIMFTDCEGTAKGMIAGEIGFTGGWYTFDDHKDCGNSDKTKGTTHPDPADAAGPVFTDYGTAPAPKLEGAQKSNTKGIHIWGDEHTGFAGGIGVGLKSLMPVDLTKKKLIGVRFVGRAAAATPIHVKLTDTVSEPTGKLCAENEFPACAGYTAGGTLYPTGQGCFDAPAADVDLGTEWREYRVFFTKAVNDDAATPAFEAGPMKRGGWGAMAADNAKTTTEAYPLRVNEAYQFQIQIDPAFDAWFDNFGFIIEGEEQDTGTAK